MNSWGGGGGLSVMVSEVMDADVALDEDIGLACRKEGVICSRRERRVPALDIMAD